MAPTELRDQPDYVVGLGTGDREAVPTLVKGLKSKDPPSAALAWAYVGSVRRGRFLQARRRLLGRYRGFCPRALSLGKALAGLTAQTKGRRLGIYKPRWTEYEIVKN